MADDLQFRAQRKNEPLIHRLSIKHGQPRVPDPPRPHRWFLILTIVLLATWMVFLAYIALRPS